jgi:acyl-CoA thioesterase
VERLAAFFEKDSFARENGVHITEVRQGFARTVMTVEPRHLNAVGIVQGGAVFTLADLAFALACNSHGVVAVACQVDIT